jgi:colanic acid/amylovoran biosynthesis protein
MRLAITNTVALNGGDAAILLCLMQMLRQAFGNDTQIVVFDSQADIAVRYYPEITFRPMELVPARRLASRSRRIDHALARFERARFLAALRLWSFGVGRFLLRSAERRLVEEYATVDLMVSTGGTYLVENYDFSFRLAHLSLAQAAGTHIVLFTQSLGPFRNPRNRNAIQRVLSGVRLILLRDSRSRGHLIEVGVPDALLRVCADGVFSLADPERLAAAADRPTSEGSRLRVAVSVREWTQFGDETPEEGMDRYCRAIAATAEHLVRVFGAEIVFLSTCQGIPEYRADDSAVAWRIGELLPPDVRSHVNIDRSFHRPEQLMDAYAGFDLLISTRLHAAILALCAGIPVFPIEYEFKTTEVFARLGLREWVQDIRTVRPETLPEKLGQFITALPGLRRDLFRAVRSERDSACEAIDLLARAATSPV